MKIDWEKQPADFPLWLEGTNEEHRKHSGWYRDVGQVFEGAYGGQWRACREGQFFTVYRNPGPLPWTGEGLPPVGTVCEFIKHNSPPTPNGQWVVGDIRYLSDCYVIIGGDGCEHAHHPSNCSFRPIRTPEQAKAEERTKACDAIYGVLLNAEREGNRSDMAEALYDAGYRKQVAP